MSDSISNRYSIFYKWIIKTFFCNRKKSCILLFFIALIFFVVFKIDGGNYLIWAVIWATSCIFASCVVFSSYSLNNALLLIVSGIGLSTAIVHQVLNAYWFTQNITNHDFIPIILFSIVAGFFLSLLHEYRMTIQAKGATRSLSVLAHEVRSPLLALSNGLDSVQDVLCDTSPNCPEIEIVNRLQRRIRDVQNGLNFYLHNMQASTKEKLLIETFPAESVINDVTETLASTTTIPFKVEVEPCLVAGNKVGTRQVLMNLVRNAINACSAVQHDTCITIRGSIENNTYIFSVIDTAASLSHKNAENIFEPFITYSRNGMGIGLYVSRLICEKMGCNLRVTIKNMVSTTFAFSLNPAYKEKPFATAGSGKINS